MPAIAAVSVLAIVIAAATLSGGNGDGNGTGQFTGSADTSAFIVPGLTVPASTMPAVATVSTAAPIVKTSIDRPLGPGSAGANVMALQSRLTSLGFAPGVADGLFGGQTEQAVWAFEKLVLGTPRAQATGIVTNETWQRMQDPIVIQPRRTGSGTHVEIYLPEQVAAVFTDDVAMLVIHIASGDDQEWCETVNLTVDEKGNTLDPPVAKEVCGISKTPGGVFRFTWKVQGHRVGALGGMDNPVYFNFGIAMHGSQNVPLEPASHGCIRMHKVISESFQSYVHIRDLVYVWGQDGKQPEHYTKQESLPVFDYPDPSATTTTTSTTTTTIAPTTTTAAPTTTTRPVPTTTTAVQATTTTVATGTTAAPPTGTTTTAVQP